MGIEGRLYIKKPIKKGRRFFSVFFSIFTCSFFPYFKRNTIKEKCFWRSNPIQNRGLCRKVSLKGPKLWRHTKNSSLPFENPNSLWEFKVLPYNKELLLYQQFLIIEIQFFFKSILLNKGSQFSMYTSRNIGHWLKYKSLVVSKIPYALDINTTSEII